VVRCFTLENLDIPEEENKHSDDQSSADEIASTNKIVVNQSTDDHPCHKEASDQVEYGHNNRVDAFHSENGQIQQVEHEQHNVDNDDNRVHGADESDTSFAVWADICCSISMPPAAEHPAGNNESKYDLQDFDDPAIGVQVAGV